MFSDREFYSDCESSAVSKNCSTALTFVTAGWNSVSFDEFSRRWNVPVHAFLLRHVCAPPSPRQLIVCSSTLMPYWSRLLDNLDLSLHKVPGGVHDVPPERGRARARDGDRDEEDSHVPVCDAGADCLWLHCRWSRRELMRSNRADGAAPAHHVRAATNLQEAPCVGQRAASLLFSVKVLAFLTHLPTAVLLAGPSERKSFQPSESKPRF